MIERNFSHWDNARPGGFGYEATGYSGDSLSDLLLPRFCESGRHLVVGAGVDKTRVGDGMSG